MKDADEVNESKFTGKVKSVREGGEGGKGGYEEMDVYNYQK